MSKQQPFSIARGLLFAAILGIGHASVFAADKKNDGAIHWQAWSDTVFQKAKKENRFVLLDLGAVWCHWCHVMDDVTYRDPKVIALINAQYIAVRVDQDSRPDLSNRYEDYGWPATVVFNPDGGEIVKRRGYMPPKPMASMLQAIIDDPTPGPSVGAEPETELESDSQGMLPPELLKKLRAELRQDYDAKNHGWGTVLKFLDWDNVEFCMGEAARGDAEFGRMARDTLAASLKLIDPVWGGVCQYSTDGDWDHPHFEKIMQMQAEDMRIFSQAFAMWGDTEDLHAAKRIGDFLKNFLTSDSGAFFTSMDADLIPGKHSGEYFVLDDAGRRKQGIPRIDRHIYSRENGWAITALSALYAATGEQDVLDEAVRPAKWIIANRSLPDGGFRHDEKDTAGPYLGDTIAMARAFLNLYTVTADRDWLRRAGQSMRFIDANFKGKTGYLASAERRGATLKPKPQIDENIAVVRVANLLFNCTGDAEYRNIAEHAMRYLATPGITDSRGFQVAGFLLADRELRVPPLHITIVGKKDDAAARALFMAALKNPTAYKRIEWLDTREGALPNADVPYPQMDKAAAFICTERSCSLPIFSVEKILAAGKENVSH
jgi:hypothetical protein